MTLNAEVLGRITPQALSANDANYSNRGSLLPGPVTARPIPLEREDSTAIALFWAASPDMRWLGMLPSIKKPDDTPNPEGWKPCPNCQANSATKSGFTWWGGFLGPRLLTHVVCHACNTGYIKAEMLEFLKEARDLAKDLYDALPPADQAGPEMQPTADPAAMQALEEAQIAYDEAQAQAIADGRAALEASDLVYNTPSDLAPCGSEELRYMLQTTVCDVPFENQVSAEEGADVPGLSQAIEDYITELCTAVELVCELEE